MSLIVLQVSAVGRVLRFSRLDSRWLPPASSLRGGAKRFDDLVYGQGLLGRNDIHVC